MPSHNTPQFTFAFPVQEDTKTLRAVLTRPEPFSGSQLDWHGKQNAAHVISDLPSFLGRNPHVSSLNFDNCSLSGDQTDQVLAIVAQYPQVKFLNLDNNTLNEQQSVVLVQVLADHDFSHLEGLSLSLMKSSEKKYSLAGGQFNEPIVRILETARNLQSLSLNNMAIEEEFFVESVLPLLPESLTNLSLNGNFLYAPSLTAFLASTPIPTISLKSSRISLFDAHDLMNTALSNQQIRSLDIRDFIYTPTRLKQLQTQLHAWLERDVEGKGLPHHLQILLDQDSNELFSDPSRFMADQNVDDEGAETDYSWESLLELENEARAQYRAFNAGARQAIDSFYS